MKWVVIILLVAVCSFLLISKFYLVKNRKTSDSQHSSQKDTINSETENSGQ